MIKKAYRDLWRSHWPPMLCFIVTFCWFGVFACMGIDIHHDGIMLKPATDVANGQVLFRDTFTQYGALTTFIQALAIKMFGPYLIVIRLATVFFYSLSAVLLHYIWRNFLSPAFFWVTYALFLLLAPFYAYIFLPWSSVYALFFMLLANLCLLNFIKHGSVWMLWGAGISSALAFWTRQPNGIVMYLALFLYFSICLALERKSWRRILSNFGVCTAAYLICCLCFLVYLGLNDALADWYFQSIRFMFSFGIAGIQTTSLFECLFPRSVFIVFPVVTLAVLGVSLYSLFYRQRDAERPRELMLIVTAIIGLASWHQYFPVPCLRHFYWAAIPMLGFYALAFQRIVNFSVEAMRLRLCRQLPRLSRVLLVFILLLPFCSTVGRMAWDVTAKLGSIPETMVFIDSPLRYILLSNADFQDFQGIRDVMGRIPPEFSERPGLNLTRHAIYSLCFPNGNNLFPMYVNWGNEVYPNYYDQVTRVLTEVRPIVIAAGSNRKTADSNRKSEFPGDRVFAVLNDSNRKLAFPGYSLFAVIKDKDMEPKLHFYLPDVRQKTEVGGQAMEGREQQHR